MHVNRALGAGIAPSSPARESEAGADDAAVGVPGTSGVPGPNGNPAVAAEAVRIAGATGAWRDRRPLARTPHVSLTEGRVNRCYGSRTNPKAGVMPKDSNLNCATLSIASS